MVKVGMAADNSIGDPWQSFEESGSRQATIEKQTVGSHLQPVGAALPAGICAQGE
jgi:hypothetical protein